MLSFGLITPLQRSPLAPRVIKWATALCVGFMALTYSSAQSPPLRDYANDFKQVTLSYETLAAPAASASISQYLSKPPGFPPGLEGLGVHYGTSVGDNISGKFMQKFVFAAASHRRDKYQAHVSESWVRRLFAPPLYCVFSDAPDLKGFNWSGIPASIATASLSNAYQPAEQRNLLATGQRTGTNLLGYVLGNEFAEWSPPLCKVAFLRPILGRERCPSK